MATIPVGGGHVLGGRRLEGVSEVGVQCDADLTALKNTQINIIRNQNFAPARYKVKNNVNAGQPVLVGTWLGRVEPQRRES